MERDAQQVRRLVQVPYVLQHHLTPFTRFLKRFPDSQASGFKRLPPNRVGATNQTRGRARISIAINQRTMPGSLDNDARPP